MNRFFPVFITCFLVIGLHSCSEYKPTPTPRCADNPELAASSLTVKFDALWDTVPFRMGRPYSDDFENEMRADVFKNYISMVTLVAEDGSEVLLKDFLLVDYSVNNEVKVEVPSCKYTSLKLGVGIPAEFNTDQDPSVYPSSSPLSVAGSQGMFWQWSTGYIFAKFEGRADTSDVGEDSFLLPIAIHAGNDASFRAFESDPFILELNGDSATISVHLLVNKLFSPDQGNEVNLTENAVTHSQNNSQLATNYMNNFVAALVVEP
ncbi:MAG: hypothetical protein RL040_1252 [Bacteroidota bacterium]